MPSENTADLTHVSDTALMVAACRAMETTLPEALVRDPFAAELAGSRGTAILESISRRELLRFGVAIRSHFLDELVTYAIDTHQLQTVVNFGAGLDTRPWRLDLPNELRWIEVDFPAMLEYKAGIMDRHEPKCRVERIAADLDDAEARRAVFAAAGSGPGLMITEGLLMYLGAATIEALAAEPACLSGIRFWIMDVASPEMARRTRMGVDRGIENLRAATHLDGTEILHRIHHSGWASQQHRSYTADAWALAKDRIMEMMKRAAAPPEPMPANDPSGVHLFGITAACE